MNNKAKSVLFVLGWGIVNSSPVVAATVNQNALPVSINSDAFSADLVTNTATYSGNVVAIQGTRKFNADTLTLMRGSDGKLESMVGKGHPATTEEKPNPNDKIITGRANTIYYLPRQNLIKYVGDAEFTQGGNIFTGDVITYNTVTQIASAPKTMTGHGVTTIIIPPADPTSKQGVTKP